MSFHSASVSEPHKSPCHSRRHYQKSYTFLAFTLPRFLVFGWAGTISRLHYTNQIMLLLWWRIYAHRHQPPGLLQRVCVYIYTSWNIILLLRCQAALLSSLSSRILILGRDKKWAWEEISCLLLFYVSWFVKGQLVENQELCFSSSLRTSCACVTFGL